MKKIILIIVITIAVTASLMWLGIKSVNKTNTPVTDSNTKSSLIVSEKLYDFGTISMKNGNVSKKITITNPTAANITISSATTSCMCTKVFITAKDGIQKGPYGMQHGGGYVPPVDEIIAPGESREMEIVYDPNAHGPAGVGPIDRFATLIDSTGGKLAVEIKAVVTP